MNVSYRHAAYMSVMENQGQMQKAQILQAVRNLLKVGNPASETTGLPQCKFLNPPVFRPFSVPYYCPADDFPFAVPYYYAINYLAVLFHNATLCTICALLPSFLYTPFPQ